MTKLFEKFSLKDVQLRNRIAVAPMCQYSSEDGFPNDWHFVHLGSRAAGGAGLVVVEATAVSPEGRISPADSGIYTDSHIESFSKLATVIKQHRSVPGIQLAHAGRKASANKPWEGDDHISNAKGADIQRVKSDFVSSAQRCLAAGFEWLELHFAHGYLASEFYSPLANQRTDQYGGDFENRIRFLLETFSAVREVWPERLPLTARLSITDWVDGGVTVEESIELARRLKNLGLDLLDVSHGFVVPGVAEVPCGPGFMIPGAGRIRREAEVPVAVGWMITEPQQAESALRDENLDLVMLARELLRNPYWPFHAAQKLGHKGAGDLLPV
jgi:2,4-dienoyl-CoA reductase-like NADH-dependent reductase (Old Yellow Enzyme family)